MKQKDINLVNELWIQKHAEIIKIEEKMRKHYMLKVDKLLKDGKTFKEIKESMREIPDDCVIKVLVFRKILILEEAITKK